MVYSQQGRPGCSGRPLFFPTANMNFNTLQNMLILLFAGVACFLGYYIYSSNMVPVEPPPELPGSFMRTEAQFRDKLTALNIDKNKVANGLKKLNAIKKKVVTDLREKGVKSGADYFQTEDKTVKLKVLELQKTIQQIKKGENAIETYETAIGNIRSMLAKFERERVSETTALTEAQAIELDEIILDLDEKLEVEADLFRDQELMELLDAEMIE